MEVNSSPGLEGIEGATGLDIAGVIIDYIASQVSFPELDVRQRLSVSANYGVAEGVVHDGGRRICEADYRLFGAKLARGATLRAAESVQSLA